MKTEVEIRDAIHAMEEDTRDCPILYRVTLKACISMAQWVLGDDTKEANLLQEGLDKGKARRAARN